jgi:membrane dipeptidase
MKIPNGSQVVLQAAPLAAMMVVVTMTLVTATLAATPPSDANVDAKARAIDARVLKIDTHTDVLLPGSPAANFTPDHASQTALDKLERGGIGALTIAIAVGPGPRTPEGTARLAPRTASTPCPRIDYPSI